MAASTATEICVVYEFIRIFKTALCKKATRQPSPTRLILEYTPLMCGGESVSDSSALCSFKVCARWNIAPFSCALLDSEFHQFGFTVLFSLLLRHFDGNLRHFCAVFRHFCAVVSHFYVSLRWLLHGSAYFFLRFCVTLARDCALLCNCFSRWGGFLKVKKSLSSAPELTTHT